jgi:hypothetical protein
MYFKLEIRIENLHLLCFLQNLSKYGHKDNGIVMLNFYKRIMHITELGITVLYQMQVGC